MDVRKISRFEKRVLGTETFSKRTPLKNFFKQDFFLFLALLVLDQGTKQAILTYIPLSISQAITPFLNVTHVQNRGISFGLFQAGSQEGKLLLLGIALFILIFLGLWYRNTKDFWTSRALVCIMAGALGNMIDRIFYGAVIDFLDFHAWGLHFPAFNVADTAITLGAMVLIFLQLLDEDFSRGKKST